MKIQIYQINMERDTNKVAFRDYSSLEELQGSSTIEPQIYDKVFEGEVDCETLEDVFQKFNLNHPEGYTGRSLSVSDVVEVINDASSAFYYCDSVGFKTVDFFPEFASNKEQPTEKHLISVLLVEPNQYPRMIEIEDDLQSMQQIVGGYIEYLSLDDVALICNEEGKINGLPLNRALYSAEGEIVEIIAGNFFLCYDSAESDTFLSLPKELADKYYEIFKLPERFAITPDKTILVEKYNPLKGTKEPEKDIFDLERD